MTAFYIFLYKKRTSTKEIENDNTAKCIIVSSLVNKASKLLEWNKTNNLLYSSSLKRIIYKMCWKEKIRNWKVNQRNEIIYWWRYQYFPWKSTKSY